MHFDQGVETAIDVKTCECAKWCKDLGKRNKNTVEKTQNQRTTCIVGCLPHVRVWTRILICTTIPVSFPIMRSPFQTPDTRPSSTYSMTYSITCSITRSNAIKGISRSLGVMGPRREVWAREVRGKASINNLFLTLCCSPMENQNHFCRLKRISSVKVIQFSGRVVNGMQWWWWPKGVSLAVLFLWAGLSRCIGVTRVLLRQCLSETWHHMKSTTALLVE